MKNNLDNKSNEIKVSVIVPVYNAEKWLRKCLDSILGQSLSDFELILVNDGSTDDSLDICREYERKDERVKVIDSINQGCPEARNLGRKMSVGNWIINCDSDDWMEPEMLEKLYRAGEDNEADLVCCGCYMEFKDGSIMHLYPYESMEEKCFVMRIGGIYSSLWNKLIRRSFLERTGVWSVKGTTMCEDLLVTTPLRFFSDKTLIINEPLYHYNRLVEDSMCQKSEGNHSGHIRATHILEEYFKDKKDDKIVKSILCNFQYRNKWRVGFEEWKKAFPHPVISMMALKQYGRVATIKYLIACVMPVWAYKGLKRVFKRKKST